MSLVSRIKDLADERNVKFAEIERDIGISNGQIRRWDKASPKTENLEKIANYFQVSTDYLLGKTDVKNWSQLDNKLTDKHFDSIKRAENAPEWATDEDVVELEVMLRSNQPMAYGGIELSKEDRERIDAVLEQVFWERLKEKRESN